MKESLQDLKLMLVYVLEFIIEERQRSVVLRPIDAGNGVILEETSDGSGIMRGTLVSGGMVEIPAVAITNIFQSWWRLSSDDGRGGRRISYTDDEERVGNQAANDVGKGHRWDANGAYKHAEEVDRPPQDAKRIYHKDKRPQRYRDDDE